MAKTRKITKINKKRKSIYNKICLPKIYSMDSIWEILYDMIRNISLILSMFLNSNCLYS